MCNAEVVGVISVHNTVIAWELESDPELWTEEALLVGPDIRGREHELDDLERWLEFLDDFLWNGEEGSDPPHSGIDFLCIAARKTNIQILYTVL